MIPLNHAVVNIHPRLVEPVYRVAGRWPLNLNPLNLCLPCSQNFARVGAGQKLPPAPFRRENTFPPTLQRIVAPAAAGLDLVARDKALSSCRPTRRCSSRCAADRRFRRHHVGIPVVVQVAYGKPPSRVVAQECRPSQFAHVFQLEAGEVVHSTSGSR